MGIWKAKGKPVTDGVKFTGKGNGFFIAGLPVKAEQPVITISRK